MKTTKFLQAAMALLIANNLTCYAQISQIEISGRYNPTSKYLPPADSSSKPGKAVQSEINAAAQINFYTGVDSLNRIRSFGSNVQFRYTNFSRNGYNELILPTDLYCTNVGLYYYSTINQKWAYNVFFNTALNTDFKKIDKNDIFLAGGAVLSREFTPNFSLGFGALVHNNLGGFMPWPALTVDWKMGGKFRLDIRTPDKSPGIAHYVGISYAAYSKLNLSLAFQPEVVSYDVTPNRERTNRLMSFWQLPFTLSSAFQVGDFEIIPSVGFTALRRYAYGEKKISEMFTEYPYHGLGTNLIYGLGIKYRPFKK
ncbi:DUF6268 family outer membrane beta-barrel protein [Dyadobacter aurulentus]|uniref:DUF6268 family outer membrane beta-barrel protein n=1 Tax=Dyadobacter sp. UC 10 TaxID=2605428 RepID=UPI0011F28432|nr:DUF6268 family outer membrane beta-barrel protein [Dyadobacter sp. UC 10]KAA0993542.1 hypothetical protein FXO21_26865 [Dyadobacter sp. UC 10]